MKTFTVFLQTHNADDDVGNIYIFRLAGRQMPSGGGGGDVQGCHGSQLQGLLCTSQSAGMVPQEGAGRAWTATTMAWLLWGHLAECPPLAL